ncbi:MAG: hypothetical protein ACI9FZ_000619 [Bacteroidia bacterium]|jgi:hypothetical protein
MRHTRNHRRAARFPILPCTGMGLSSLHCYLWSGELLPPLFTLTSGKPEAVIFCDTIRHARLPSRAPAFTGIPALRCPDFPLIPEGTSERPHAEVDERHSATQIQQRKRQFYPSFLQYRKCKGEACYYALGCHARPMVRITGTPRHAPTNIRRIEPPPQHRSQRVMELRLNSPLPDQY